MRVSSILSFLISASPALAQETIGPWNLEAAPISASPIVEVGSGWGWLNVVDRFVSVADAFSGVGIAEEGYANGGPGTTVEMEFAAGVARNGEGDDLVMFDARFSASSYELSTDYDGFQATVALHTSSFIDTGETRDYYYENNSIINTAPVAASPVDLSDLGVPFGASVSRVRWRAVSGGVDALGVGVLEGRFAVSYCSPAVPNSTGAPARISAEGSPYAASNDLTLIAQELPSGEFGYFLVGSNQGMFTPPGSQGVICLTCSGFQGCAGIGRFNRPGEIIQGPLGSLSVDLTALPLTPPMAVQPGETWNFQCWYRDLGSSNFTDAVSIAFL